MIRTTLGAAMMLALTTTGSLALDVTKSVDVAAAPDAVWKTIGDFCGIGQWHPAIEKCALSKKGDKELRTLSLKGGGTIVEEQLSRSDTKMDYTYAILESPLPVADYKSTISVAKSGGGSKITWTGSFKAKGADDAKAKEVIGGIYDSGLAVLAKAK